MGFRFRKSKNFGPFRINFSKSGVGYSIGGKWFRVTKKARGGYRTTASLPGTGISYTKETKGSKKESEISPSTSKFSGGDLIDNNKKTGMPPKKSFPWGWIIFAFFIIAIMVYIQSPAAIFCLFAAVAVFPLGPLSRFWKQEKNYRVLQIVCVLFLTLMASLFVPENMNNMTSVSEPSESGISSMEQVSSSIGISSEYEQLESSSSQSSNTESTQFSSSETLPVVSQHEDISDESFSSQTSPSVVPPVASEPEVPESSIQTSPPEVSQQEFVGSIDSNKYHYPTCRFAKKILPENEIWFNSTEDAKAQGYEPCGTCKPD